MRLSVTQARAIMLAAQGLLEAPRRPATKDSVLETIRLMGALQIDTIHVVARSPYLVLWSRLGRYDPAWLDELLAEGRLFEYWSHAACFLPIEDYSLYRPTMVEGRPRARAWIEAHRELAERVLKRVREDGPVRSSDFERKGGRSTGWWDWKPEKTALECLFSTGELMIARRDRFQRIYDLRERVLPGWDDGQTLSPEQAKRLLVMKTIAALGVTKARWVANYFGLQQRDVPDHIASAVQSGEIVEVAVEGWNVPGYVHADNLLIAEVAASGELSATHTTLLSPFDPLIWDRARAEELFDFSYRIEVYTPAPRRRYGYFSMPILHRGALVGRLDPKAHRKERLLEVRALHLEPGVRVTRTLVSALRKMLADFAGWQGLDRVEVRVSDPPDLAQALQAA